MQRCIKAYPVPLSMTTAGREVAGSMRMREEVSLLEVVGVDLRLRSKRAFRAEDHGREGRFEEREDE
jgi:hypothetical protein